MFKLDIIFMCSLKNIINFTESGNVSYFISNTKIKSFINYFSISLGIITIPI